MKLKKKKLTFKDRLNLNLKFNSKNWIFLEYLKINNKIKHEKYLKTWNGGIDARVEYSN